MLKEKLVPFLVAWLIRLIGLTLRIRLDDRSGVRSGECGPAIWVLWHNRMLIMPIIRARYYKHRHGSVLTSPSKDGEIIAQVMRRFKIGSVRGSSSRRGALAMLELTRVLKSGGDIAITPDGPRGPRYVLGAGAISLAQKTGAPIVPIHVEYSRCVRLKSWDQFMIPLPFSRVEVVFDELFRVSGDFEAERARLEQILQPKTP